MRGPLWQRQRRRRLIAIVTAVLWLLAVEVLPNLHLAFHQHDHTHRQDGTIVWLSHGAHHDAAAHDAVAHDHHARVPRPAHEHGFDARAHHGHDGLAHDHDALGYLDPEALGTHGDVVLADHALLDHEAHLDHDHDALADHDHEALADHDHDALADHHHEALAHHDDAGDTAATGDAGHRHRRKRTDHVAFDVVPTAHAATGIAHHALALLDPPPPLLAPVGAPEPEAWSHAAPRTLVESRFHSRPNARGPPTA